MPPPTPPPGTKPPHPSLRSRRSYREPRSHRPIAIRRTTRQRKLQNCDPCLRNREPNRGRDRKHNTVRHVLRPAIGAVKRQNATSIRRSPNKQNPTARHPSTLAQGSEWRNKQMVYDTHSRPQSYTGGSREGGGSKRDYMMNV
ncbi:hypothetical protein EVAR_70080_1 [Eumeta japonica]|uniref:Uncharacterized protein n=1 Tax=Eumeta variegata TaxID=151549 RepID=A0A4C2AG24_EUMVA|nr:hypothetical protein EVAR_70080_1 [Eumeta japonica]